MTLEQPDNLEGKKDTTADAVAVPPAAEAEHGAVKKKIDIPGVGEIEYTEKKIMFPEKIVQETGGVKGYVRKMVSWDSYNNALEKIISVEEIKELGLLDIEVRPYLYGDRYGDLYEDEKEEIAAVQQKISDMIKINSIESLEIIQETLNTWDRLLSGYYTSTHNKKDEAVFKERLSESKWQTLKNKIPKANKLLRNVIDALSNNFIKNTYVHVMDGVWSTPTEKDAKEKFKKRMLLQEIFDPELTRSDRDFRGWHRAGLSVSNGGFWTCDGNDNTRLSQYCDRPFFGFSYKNAAFASYLKSCLDIVWYGNTKVDYIVGSSENIKAYQSSARAILDNRHSSAYGTENKHPIIPVISAENIPKLRWCHAQYAYIPTKNGYNIIEMIT